MKDIHLILEQESNFNEIEDYVNTTKNLIITSNYNKKFVNQQNNSSSQYFKELEENFAEDKFIQNIITMNNEINECLDN